MKSHWHTATLPVLIKKIDWSFNDSRKQTYTLSFVSGANIAPLQVKFGHLDLWRYSSVTAKSPSRPVLSPNTEHILNVMVTRVAPWYTLSGWPVLCILYNDGPCIVYNTSRPARRTDRGGRTTINPRNGRHHFTQVLYFIYKDTIPIYPLYVWKSECQRTQTITPSSNKTITSKLR